MIKLAELLDEKHLTPAELKKREEIVKGLKKSGMKQSPKMYAIATAKAEKIAEGEDHEVESTQSSYAHMRPFKLEIAKIMSQLGALNDKIEKKGPLSKEIVKAFESLGMLISNINTDRKI